MSPSSTSPSSLFCVTVSSRSGWTIGKERTLVGLSFCRYCALSVLDLVVRGQPDRDLDRARAIVSSSPCGVSAIAARRGAGGERFPVARRATGLRATGVDLKHRLPLIGLDDPPDDRVAHDVAGGEAAHRDALDPLEPRRSRRRGPTRRRRRADRSGWDRRRSPSGCSRRSGSGTSSSAPAWCSAPRRG